MKVKVGIGDDAGRLAAVRAAVGPRFGIRIDANGAWQTPEEALANLRALAPVGLELCEEPVHGVDALREVRAGTDVKIAMDETHAPGSGAADAVCLKITRGGITRRAARRPRGARGGVRHLLVVDVRRAARDRGRGPRRRRPAGHALVRTGDRLADRPRRSHRRSADARACMTLRGHR